MKDKEVFEHVVAIPGGLEKSSAIVKVESSLLCLTFEISGDGHSKIILYSHNKIHLQINKQSGFVKVSSKEDQKSLPKTYIKCFVKTRDGQVKFFKDGFTDMRGCFEYCNFEGTNTSNMERFSIYVQNERLGCLVEEIEIPANAGGKKERVRITSERWIGKQSKAQAQYGNIMDRIESRKMAVKSKKCK